MDRNFRRDSYFSRILFLKIKRERWIKERKVVNFPEETSGKRAK